MNFENSLKEGFVRNVVKNVNRARSLERSAKQAIDTAKLIPLNDGSLKTILRELYEGLRQYCEAIGFLHGYKFESHESINYFLRDVLKESKVAEKFDRYRKLRNRVNYYGEEIEVESVKGALIEVPEIMKVLSKHLGVREKEK